MKPVILVTGKNGQLGQELQSIAGLFPGYEFIFTDRSNLDISDFETVTNFFNSHKVDICINAAAYTAVDKAETDQEAAIKINSTAVGNLASVCASQNAQFIHISTDYVYDGLSNAPYKEDHPTSPVNFYGQTKLKGEQLALLNDPTTVIIRTSWVYSRFGNNFVKTMLRLTGQKEILNVVDDQLGSPTYATDLAEAIMTIVEKVFENGRRYGGVYHFSNEGIISWYEFAIEINAVAGNHCLVNPIHTSGFPTPAKRPAYSALNKQKISSTFAIELKDWKDQLSICLKLIKQES